MDISQIRNIWRRHLNEVKYKRYYKGYCPRFLHHEVTVHVEDVHQVTTNHCADDQVPVICKIDFWDSKHMPFANNHSTTDSNAQAGTNLLRPCFCCIALESNIFCSSLRLQICIDWSGYWYVIWHFWSWLLYLIVE